MGVACWPDLLLLVALCRFGQDRWRRTRRCCHSCGCFSWCSCLETLCCCCGSGEPSREAREKLAKNQGPHGSGGKAEGGDARFQAACAKLEALIRDNKSPGQETLLKAYGLFKQATEGDAEDASQPSSMYVKSRAKYDAWAAVRGLSRAQAKAEYVTMLDGL
eukprot:TRINITY_DN110692_c0_g1_i1.p1 TRINITY_DN110692_c0_g1~~TRINITY_DN110692_c0_g1_i1.p1  ORF type:complete len:169 (-),score=25.20 TRINITY_DN110692_c0_g1_i1:80-565(-)